MEESAGEQNEGVELALYFARKAPSITSAYGILADKNLLKVVQTALGLSEYTSYQDIDKAGDDDLQHDGHLRSGSGRGPEVPDQVHGRYDAANSSRHERSTASSILFGSTGGARHQLDILSAIQSLKLGG